MTAVHKANSCGCRTGCFSNGARGGGALPDVDYEERIMDAMAALLVRDAGASTWW